MQGMVRRQVLEWEHRVDDHIHSNTGEDDTARTKTPDNAWEEDELKHAIQAPVSGQPETNRLGTEIEPAQLDWRRPDKWDERHC